MIKRWIINIIDQSGSMSHLKETVIKDYNLFLQETKNDINDIRWTSILFNNKVKVLNDDSIKNVEDLQDTDYVPQYSTAMLDAIGKGCLKIIKNSVEYNDIVMNIFTDGNENSSDSYTYSSVNDLLDVIKDKYTLTTNFYCTLQDSQEVPNKIPSIDTRYISNSLHECLRQMSSNSQLVVDHGSVPNTCPQIKRQKMV